jgi:capsular exopolysaccharide synthesis family protein
MKRFITKNGQQRSRGERQDLLLQEFGHLSTHVRHALKTAPGMQRIGFCATNPGEGCSSVAANYAIFCGQQGLKTTLIEADLRHPSLAEFFSVAEAPGLSELLDGTAKVSEVLCSQVAAGVNLIPAGTPPSTSSLACDSFDLTSIFEQLAPHNDIVIVDTPALTFSPEANTILTQLDGVVLVLQANRSRLCAVERSVHQLQQLDVRIIGSVLNKMRYDLPTLIDRWL